MPKTTKQLKRLIGITQFFPNYIPSLSVKLMSFYTLLKKDAVIKITEDVKALDVINEGFNGGHKCNITNTKKPVYIM